ncbi:hypothetical protein [Rheinheimera sp.]|uniref:hypothetical protein n=1 Tax=Rheinheimera sp. TaxID=1869214 RepID=UPI00307DD9AA
MLDAAGLKAKVAQVSSAWNQVMLKGSVLADLDRLFSPYSDDFVYRHGAYGGEYSKAELSAMQSQGRYTNMEPCYRILTQLPGYKAVAVERQGVQNRVAVTHFAVFEFDGDKVSRIIEYWK